MSSSERTLLVIIYLALILNDNCFIFLPRLLKLALFQEYLQYSCLLMRLLANVSALNLKRDYVT